MRVVDRARSIAIPIAKGREDWEEVLEEAENLRKLAKDLAKLRDPRALIAGRRALQCFLAPILSDRMPAGNLTKALENPTTEKRSAARDGLKPSSRTA